MQNYMENPFKKIGGAEAEYRENYREFSELALAAREKAESLLGEASMKKNIKERLVIERRAYTIYAALDFLECEISPETKRVTDSLIKNNRIHGFTSKESARTFIEDSVELREEAA